ncbi:helix-turn-helix domain-containing protein [Butyricicoccus faecihominis]|uniref:helix-turn-helix domain-containing protein n=1 Tax=Butyricicoccus faecihominis TaxID=1712515 RepID=UPI0024785B55|nr:helix-turn-helix transcriptional regulator [Butyricicoccus faecihominis]MCQ5130832.1 helix-turn-helix domain-containing protein [Butyricicoccus faecihominis]
MVYDMGERLRKLRDSYHLTQDQVGKRIGVSGASVSGYENNIAMPPSEVLKELALLFRVTTDYLLGLENRKVIVIDAKNKKQEKAIDDILRIIDDTFIK